MSVLWIIVKGKIIHERKTVHLLAPTRRDSIMGVRVGAQKAHIEILGPITGA